ncbi:MAG: uroporphyrinogen decarboxylase family protein [Nitrospinota bacterium]
MSKKERLVAALRGELVDRVPLSLWGHFFDKESTAQGLAESTLSFQARWDWDYIKVQPRAEYHAELWGARFGSSPDGIEGPPCIKAVLESAGDWSRVERKGPDEGPLGEQLLALRLIAEGLKGEVPFIQTVFSPLTVACYLAGKDPGRLKDLLREEPASAHAALGAIAETFRAYLPLCLEAGASGIFFAVSHGPTEFMSIDEYEEFGRPYDLTVLEGGQRAGASTCSTSAGAI